MGCSDEGLELGNREVVAIGAGLGEATRLVTDELLGNVEGKTAEAECCRRTIASDMDHRAVFLWIIAGLAS